MFIGTCSVTTTLVSAFTKRTVSFCEKTLLREEQMGDIEMQQSPHDATVGVALPAYDSTFKDCIERTVGVKDVSEIIAKRLFELGQLFNGPNFEKIVDDNDPNNNCVLEFNILKVQVHR